ncbi:aspartate aminotransferase family protein [Dongia soli]|uniref:Aspartate aminotransferase family protein n=1 Tax=Dongia soli TaxID=600628 RepID=A0ABU5ED22_9PROT|nr:aspartate aminotransferase family protein [Dongia soli]MDY0884207.1 aspartate aminotransferase family protein [Dongia soli]
MSPRPNSLAARDAAFHLHGYTNAQKNEQEGGFVITRGKGIYVYDENGKEYLDGMAALWCSGLGFGEEPRLTQAAVKQMQELPFYHTFTQKVASVTVELAEKLVNLAPVPMSKAYFCNSGSEANDTVVKMIWYINNGLGRPQKKKIISRTKAYHGVTVAAASLTGLPGLHIDFDLPIAGILRTDCPHHYRFGNPGESEEDFATRCAESLEKLILREGPDTIAAMFAEPVMGAGGVIIPPKTYFAKIQAVLKKYDILLVADEVICGFGRTGNFWGSQTMGVTPDIMTMAKQLSAGVLPIAAVLVNQRVYEALRDNSAKNTVFGHGITYSGHPVCAAVALETLKIYEERKIVDRVRALEPVFLRELQRFREHPLVGECRGVGLVGAIELVKDKATRQSFDASLAVGPNLVRIAHNHGLIIRAVGDSLAFCPPMVISEAEVVDMFVRFEKSLADVAEWLKRDGHL